MTRTDSREARARKRTRRAATLTVALLLIALWLPLLAMGVLPQPKLSFTEKRLLAAWPGLPESWPMARAWPSRVERWFDDRLGFRDALISTWASQSRRASTIEVHRESSAGRRGASPR